MHIRYLVPCFVALTSLFCTGCLETREPEPPGQGSDWTPPIEANTLVSNFTRAVTSVNTGNYERCFAQSMSFIADPEVLAQNPGLFDQEWSADQERAYFTNLETSADKGNNELELNNRQIVDFTSDSLEHIYNYRLTINHEKPSLSATLFTGQIRLVMVRDEQQLWQITLWEDINSETSESNSCWSDLKAAFITG